MGQIGRAALKAYFETGDIPTQAEFIDLIDSLYNFTDDDASGIFEQKILIPTTQPALSGSDLTLDMASNRQAIFEARKSVGDLTIDSDFNFIVTNKTNALVLSCVLSLTGTRIITFEADVLISNPSSIGVWASPVLTLSAGTDDLIEFNLLRYNTSSKWLLVVGEVAI